MSFGLASKARSFPHIAIVGSGPAAWYTVQRLFQLNPNTKIDIYEKNIFPFGLIRYGVAPDHPEVRNCIHKFEEIAKANPNLQYFGNLEVGTDIPVSSIAKNYHACVFAYGASRPRSLNLKNNGKYPNVFSALDFVHWYNGHPDYMHLNFRLKDAKRALVIGHGNVALDVSRILLQNSKKLQFTDMPIYAVEALEESAIESVTIAGRRGPHHVSFTASELREILKLGNLTYTNPDQKAIRNLKDSIKAEIDRPTSRILDLLLSEKSCDPDEKERTLNFRYCLNPIAINSSDGEAADGVTFEKRRWRKFEYESTGETEDITCDIIFVSIGQDSVPINGLNAMNVKFDPKFHLLTAKGRVYDASKVAYDGSRVPGVYATGWVCNGNNAGVIAQTMIDAKATAESILEDWHNPDVSFFNNREEVAGSAAVLEENSSCADKMITWKDWKILDNFEKFAGTKILKPRRKITEKKLAFDILKEYKTLDSKRAK